MLVDFYWHLLVFLLLRSLSVVGWPWLEAGCPPKPLCHFPPQLDRGRKTEQKVCGSREGQGKLTHQLLSQAKQTRQPPSGIRLLFCGVLHHICSTVDIHGLQGDSLPRHGLLHGLQGNLCSGVSSPSSPSFFTDLGVCRVVSLTVSLVSSHCCSCCCAATFSLLKCIILEVLPPTLMGSALASGGSTFEPAGIGSVGHRGRFWQLLTEATPVAPPLPKPCHANPVHFLW